MRALPQELMLSVNALGLASLDEVLQKLDLIFNNRLTLDREEIQLENYILKGPLAESIMKFIESVSVFNMRCNRMGQSYEPRRWSLMKTMNKITSSMIQDDYFRQRLFEVWDEKLARERWKSGTLRIFEERSQD